MVELYRTNDPVLLSWMQARLAALEVPVLVFDGHASATDGAIAAVQRRIMVDEADLVLARRQPGRLGAVPQQDDVVHPQ